MALSLNAEQRSIVNMFKREEQYIIPAFQRPYSWDYDQCLQLYNDLVAAYKDQEDYFVGNIIIAINDADKKSLEVIDGQQRLTTFFLIIKVIAVLEDNAAIQAFIESSNWKGEKVVRLKSKIIETNDAKHLTQVLSYDKDKFEKRLQECLGKNDVIDSKKCKHNFEQNALCFYQWLKRFKDNREDFTNFIDYLFERVHLLPIQLHGKTSEEARRRALIIFETVNNRGMSLEDADIFKAKLYENAERAKEAQEFIIEWKDFRTKCDDLGLPIDDVFRYYSHIVRGRESITSNETNMRDFFINKKYSPFNNKEYYEILIDLQDIIGILEYIENEQKRPTAIAKWFQLIDYYSNQYPKWALVCYLFTNRLEEEEAYQRNLIAFCKNLIRYVYAKGATTTIKYEIYNIIKQVCQGGKTKSYQQSFTKESFYPLGRLKYGYALLAHYLESEKALVNYYLGRIINAKDIKYFKEQVAGWSNKDITDLLDNVANFIVTDVPQRNIMYTSKATDFTASNMPALKELFKRPYTYQLFMRREEQLMDTLLNFFNEPEPIPHEHA